VWHDVECGAYQADLPMWLELAEQHGDPILDVGAGTGRVALELARAGWDVTALDRDARLLAELGRRAHELPVTREAADAREFELEQRFALIVVPMQMIQLLEGAAGRGRFLSRARAHLRPAGLVAIALTEDFDLYRPGPGEPGPPPDVTRIGGTIYASRPTAVRRAAAGVVLERQREIIRSDGRRTAEPNTVRLDALSAQRLEDEAGDCGLVRVGRRTVPDTQDHVGSQVVMLGV
jgi:SAM-dependent methyltransferase